MQFLQPLSEKQYKKLFMLSYPSFTSPEKLLNKLIQLYIFASESKSGISEAKVIGIIKYWMEQYPYDWSEKLLSILNNFIDHHLIREKDQTPKKQLRSIIAKLVCSVPANSNPIRRAPVFTK